MWLILIIKITDVFFSVVVFLYLFCFFLYDLRPLNIPLSCFPKQRTFRLICERFSVAEYTSDKGPITSRSKRMLHNQVKGLTSVYIRNC